MSPMYIQGSCIEIYMEMFHSKMECDHGVYDVGLAYFNCTIVMPSGTIDGQCI